MPAKKIPSDNELEQLFRRGMTPAQISGWYAREKNLDIAPGTISVWKVRQSASLPVYRETYVDLIPWTVNPEHRALYPVKMLRMTGRRRAGLPLRPEDARRLDAWLEKLQDRNLVVHYDPGTAQGFFYVEPRPGKDLGPIREPDWPIVPVRGRPVEKQGAAVRLPRARR